MRDEGTAEDNPVGFQSSFHPSSLSPHPCLFYSRRKLVLVYPVIRSPPRPRIAAHAARPHRFGPRRHQYAPAAAPGLGGAAAFGYCGGPRRDRAHAVRGRHGQGEFVEGGLLRGAAAARGAARHPRSGPQTRAAAPPGRCCPRTSPRRWTARPSPAPTSPRSGTRRPSTTPTRCWPTCKARRTRWAHESPASLLGALYVLEGSRMGSMILVKSLSRAWGVPAESGARGRLPPRPHRQPAAALGPLPGATGGAATHRVGSPVGRGRGGAGDGVAPGTLRRHRVGAAGRVPVQPARVGRAVVAGKIGVFGCRAK